MTTMVSTTVVSFATIILMTAIILVTTVVLMTTIILSAAVVLVSTIVLPTAIVLMTTIILMAAIILVTPVVLMAMIIPMTPVVTTTVPLIMLRVTRICPVPIVMAIPDPLLVVAATVAGVLTPVPIIIPPWLRLVDHNLVAMIYIVIRITWRQTTPGDPTASLKIYEDAVRDIIICIYIRQVVVVDIIIANRTPYRLRSDINVDTYLCAGAKAKACSGQYSEQKNLFFHSVLRFVYTTTMKTMPLPNR